MNGQMSANKKAKKIQGKRFQIYCTIFHFALYRPNDSFFFVVVVVAFLRPLNSKWFPFDFFCAQILSAAQMILLRTHIIRFARVRWMFVHCFITANLSNRWTDGWMDKKTYIHGSIDSLEQQNYPREQKRNWKRILSRLGTLSRADGKRKHF